MGDRLLVTSNKVGNSMIFLERESFLRKHSVGREDIRDGLLFYYFYNSNFSQLNIPAIISYNFLLLLIKEKLIIKMNTTNHDNNLIKAYFNFIVRKGLGNRNLLMLLTCCCAKTRDIRKAIPQLVLLIEWPPPCSPNHFSAVTVAPQTPFKHLFDLA